MPTKHTQTGYFEIPTSTVNSIKKSVELIDAEESVSVLTDFSIILVASVIGFLVGFGVDTGLRLFTDYSGFYITATLCTVGILVTAFLLIRDRLNLRALKKEMWEEVADFSEELNSWFMLTHYISVSEFERKRVAEDMLFFGKVTRFRTTDSRLCMLTQRKGTSIWDLDKGQAASKEGVEVAWTPDTNATYMQVQQTLNKLRTCVLTVEEEHEMSRAEDVLEEIIQSVLQLSELDEVTEEDSKRINHIMNTLDISLQRIFSTKKANIRKNLDIIHGFVSDNNRTSASLDLSR